jgi:hypothetical protein
VPATRPLLALLTALCLLFALPVAGASAKHHRHGHGHSARKHHRKHKRHRRHKHKHHTTATLTEPASPTDDTATSDRIGTISAIDGDQVTVALDGAGAETAALTADTTVICPGAGSSDDSADDPSDDTADDSSDDSSDDTADDPSDDSSDDPGDGDPSDARQAVSCAPAVGDPVYEADLADEASTPTWDLLDLSGN